MPRALPLLERAVDLCQDTDLPVFFPRQAAALGTAYSQAGRIADAVPLLTRAMEQMMATEMGLNRAFCSLSLSGGSAFVDRSPGGGACPCRGCADAHV